MYNSQKGVSQSIKIDKIEIDKKNSDSDVETLYFRFINEGTEIKLLRIDVTFRTFATEDIVVSKKLFSTKTEKIKLYEMKIEFEMVVN